MTDNTFTCDSCEQTFVKAITDEEALEEAERRRIAPVPAGETDVGVLCDDCFQEFSRWAEKNGLAATAH